MVRLNYKRAQGHKLAVGPHRPPIPPTRCLMYVCITSRTVPTTGCKEHLNHIANAKIRPALRFYVYGKLNTTFNEAGYMS